MSCHCLLLRSTGSILKFTRRLDMFSSLLPPPSPRSPSLVCFRSTWKPLWAVPFAAVDVRFPSDVWTVWHCPRIDVSDGITKFRYVNSSGIIAAKGAKINTRWRWSHSSLFQCSILFDIGSIRVNDPQLPFPKVIPPPVVRILR